jgi:hypothetical protein
MGLIIISPREGHEETDRFPQSNNQPAKADTAEPAQDLPFKTFCKKKCRYRFVCLEKRQAHRDGNCYEFELCSNALW